MQEVFINLLLFTVIQKKKPIVIPRSHERSYYLLNLNLSAPARPKDPYFTVVKKEL
jgi:hypothetical protein